MLNGALIRRRIETRSAVEEAHEIGATRRRGHGSSELGSTAPLEERMLLAAARSDPEAFGLLYQRYLPRIHRYLRLRSASEADAADLTHDVFVRAFAAFPKYRDDGLPFSAWLFAIARNRTADVARRLKSEAVWLPLDDAMGAQTSGPDAFDPEAIAVRRESNERIRRLLAGLDRDKLELVSLRFAAGLSSREIASVVGRSEAAVKQQLTRILRTLKEQAND
jgi:RNA polymerase sigma-70 factor, ECF subfamily